MVRRYRKKTARRRHSKKRKGTVFLTILSLVVLLIALTVNLLDRRLVPAVMQIEEYRINARLSGAINDSIQDLAKSGRSFSSEDFYSAVRAEDGKIQTLTANTILINEICAYLSGSLLDYLSSPVVDNVEIPIGALTGIRWLANFGPSYRIRVMPVGVAQVDYNTSFTSAGINQINFQVWLTVTAQMQIVNPLQTSSVDVVRAVPLVNTVFAGEIPGVYMNPGQAIVR